MRNGFRDRPSRRQGIDRSQRAGELKCRKRIVLSRGWIWFRDYLWSEKVGEEITLRLVDSFVIILQSKGLVIFSTERFGKGILPSSV